MRQNILSKGKLKVRRLNNPQIRRQFIIKSNAPKGHGRPS